MLKRLDLPDGQWADLLVKPKHEDYVAIMQSAEGESGVEWLLTLGRRFCKAWLVRGEDGTPLAVDDWGGADPDITDAICTEAWNRYTEWDDGRVPLVTRRRRTPRPTPPTLAPSAATSEAAPSE